MFVAFGLLVVFLILFGGGLATKSEGRNLVFSVKYSTHSSKLSWERFDV